jgi:membrane protein required for colicin V production
MNTIDIIIIALILLSAIVGFWRGLTREVLGILSWILAAIITYFLHAVPEPILAMVISSDFLKETLSALAVFLISLIVLTSITYSFSDAVRTSVAGGADKILGFLFGSFRGFLLIAILAFGANKFVLKNGENAPNFLKESRLIPIGDILITRIIQSIPATKINEWKDKLDNFFNDVSLKKPETISEVVTELSEEMRLKNDK